MIRGVRATLAVTRAGWVSQRKRTGYLVLTVAVTVASWLMLSAMAAPFVGAADTQGSGVTMTNGSQMHAPLPLHYARRIIPIAGADHTTWFAFQIATCQQAPRVSVTLNAYGGSGANAVVASEFHVSPALMRRWNADPSGILITHETAADCGWRVGEAVSPPDAFGIRQVPLTIIGILRGSHDIGLAHFDYINRVDPMLGKDKVLYFLANGGNPRGDERLAARVDAEFAHDFPAVSANTNATIQNAWARFGKVQQLLGFVMAAVLLCMASVLVSVLAHAAAQRRATFAVLQVLGFGRATFFGALVLEAAFIVIVGALVGTSLGMWLAHVLSSTRLGFAFGGFNVPVWAYEWMPLWLFVLCLAGLAWPSAVVARVRPSDYRAI